MAARSGVARPPVHVACRPAPPSQAAPLPAPSACGPPLARAHAPLPPGRGRGRGLPWPPGVAPHPEPEGATARGACARRRTGRTPPAQRPPLPTRAILAARRPLLTPPPSCTRRRRRGAGGDGERSPTSGGAVRARSPGARPGCRWRSSRGRGRRAAGGGAAVCVPGWAHSECRQVSCVRKNRVLPQGFFTESSMVSLRARTHHRTTSFRPDGRSSASSTPHVERWRQQHSDRDEGAISRQR